MKAILVALLGTACFCCMGQSEKEFFLTPHVNLYIPFSSSKKIYPFLGFQKDKPKIMVGGFGVGVASALKLGENQMIRVQGNFSRIVYWDETLNFRSPSNREDGTYETFSTDYTFGALSTLKYKLGQKWSAGPGLGLQVMLISVNYLKKDQGISTDNNRVNENHHSKIIMPTIPLELTYQNDGFLLNFRYEQALLNRYRGDLGEERKETFGLLFIEFGFRL